MIIVKENLTVLLCTICNGLVRHAAPVFFFFDSQTGLRFNGAHGACLLNR